MLALFSRIRISPMSLFQPPVTKFAYGLGSLTNIILKILNDIEGNMI